MNLREFINYERRGSVAARGARSAAGKAAHHRVPGHDHAFGR